MSRAGPRRSRARWSSPAIAAGSVELEANGHITRGSALIGLGREAEGLAALARGGELGAGNTRTALRYHINYSDALFLAGRNDDAVEVALAGIEVARSIGLERSLGSMLAGNAAEPLIARGEWERAGTMIDRALELDPPLQHRAHLRTLRAWLMVWEGRLEEADELLAEFRSLIGPVQPAPQYAVAAVRVDAEYALAVDEPDRAWASLGHALDRLDVYYAPLAYPVLAVAAATARRLDDIDGGERTGRVAALYAAARPALVRDRWDPLIRAELSNTAEDWRVAYDQALARGLGAHLAPYAGLRLAQLLTGDAERAEVKAVLAESVERAEALGAGLLTDRLAQLSRRLGLAPAAEPRSSGSTFAGLTPRELEVLRLVAEGRTNGEIGTALFISTKTASVHVSNILAKLGASGRGEAAAIAHRQGLVGV